MVLIGAALWLLLGCAYAVVIVLAFFAHRWADRWRPGGWLSTLLLALTVGLVFAPLGGPMLWETVPVSVNGREVYVRPQIVSHLGFAYGVMLLAATLAALGAIRLVRSRRSSP